MKKILPPILFLLCVFVMVVLHHVLPILRFSLIHLSVVGMVLVMVGLSIAITENRHFAKVGTNIMTFDDPDILVTDGLFKISRNPMYLGFSIALGGFALISGTLSAVVVAVGFVVWTNHHYIPFEENVMRNKFGQAYEAYCAKVRRWI